MRKGKRSQRVQKKTILLCVEGDAEECFFQELKTLIAKEDLLKTSVSIKIISAKGNVACVLKEAIKKSRDAEYSMIILVYDMDVIGDKRVEGKHLTALELEEKKNKINGICKDIASDPCFEVLLLKIFRGQKKRFASSKEVKKEFFKLFAKEAHEVSWDKEEKMTFVNLKKEELSPFFELFPVFA